jgi:hypothetical protein
MVYINYTFFYSTLHVALSALRDISEILPFHDGMFSVMQWLRYLHGKWSAEMTIFFNETKLYIVWDRF